MDNVKRRAGMHHIPNELLEHIVEYLNDEFRRKNLSRISIDWFKACCEVERREFSERWMDENNALIKPLRESGVDEETIQRREKELEVVFPFHLREFVKMNDGRRSWSEFLHASNLVDKIKDWFRNDTVVVIGRTVSGNTSLILDGKYLYFCFSGGARTKINFRDWVQMRNYVLEPQYYNVEILRHKKYFDYHLEKNMYSILPDSVRSIRKLTEKSITKDGLSLQYAKDFTNDKAMVLLAFGKNPKSIKFASPALRSDKEFMLSLIEQNPEVIMMHAEPNLLGDRDFVLKAVALSGQTLRKASPALQNDSEIVEIAVCQDGLALSYASSELKNNRAIVSSAMNSNPRAFFHASPEIQEDQALAVIAIRSCPELFTILPASLKENKQLIHLAIETQPSIIKNVKQSVLDRDFILESVNINPLVLSFVREPYQNDKDIVLRAVSKNGSMLAHSSTNCRDDKQIVLAAVSLEGKMLQFASDRLKNDKDVVLEAVTENGAALKFASKRFQKNKEMKALKTKK